MYDEVPDLFAATLNEHTMDHSLKNLMAINKGKLKEMNKKLEAARYNNGKPKLSYFRRSFHKALECVARVKEFGANKYDDDNWRYGNKPDSEYLDSLDRHLDYFIQGEVYDQDSGCHHLGHAIWNLCALFELNYSDVPVIDEPLFQERMAYWANKRKEQQEQELEQQELQRQAMEQDSNYTNIVGGQGTEFLD